MDPNLLRKWWCALNEGQDKKKISLFFFLSEPTKLAALRSSSRKFKRVPSKDKGKAFVLKVLLLFQCKTFLQTQTFRQTSPKRMLLLFFFLLGNGIVNISSCQLCAAEALSAHSGSSSTSPTLQFYISISLLLLFSLPRRRGTVSWRAADKTKVKDGREGGMKVLGWGQQTSPSPTLTSTPDSHTADDVMEKHEHPDGALADR